MSRGPVVRFDPVDPRSPDEYATPQHHTDKGLVPRGILLKVGTFEKEKNGSGGYGPGGKGSSRRDRRYSTPTQTLAGLTMQNTTARVDDYPSTSSSSSSNSYRDYHRYSSSITPSSSSRSRRRSSSVGPLIDTAGDPHHHQQHYHSSRTGRREYEYDQPQYQQQQPVQPAEYFNYPQAPAIQAAPPPPYYTPAPPKGKALAGSTAPASTGYGGSGVAASSGSASGYATHPSATGSSYAGQVSSSVYHYQQQGQPTHPGPMPIGTAYSDPPPSTYSSHTRAHGSPAGRSHSLVPTTPRQAYTPSSTSSSYKRRSDSHYHTDEFGAYPARSTTSKRTSGTGAYYDQQQRMTPSASGSSRYLGVPEGFVYAGAARTGSSASASVGGTPVMAVDAMGALPPSSSVPDYRGRERDRERERSGRTRGRDKEKERESRERGRERELARDGQYQGTATQKPPPTVQDVSVDRNLRHPRIAWNVAYPFASAAFDAQSKLTPADLDTFATHPAIDKFSIKFESSGAQAVLRALYRSIKVRGSYAYEYNGSTIFLVTKRDVVNAVYEFLQVPVTRAEWAKLSGREARIAVEAQRRRVAGAGKEPAFGDALRVDLLGDVVKFEGVRVGEVKERRVTFGIELGRW